MNKVLISCLLVAAVISRSYPTYKQCDPQWANDQLGTSSNTICRAGCLMSSAAMALTGTGHSQNPHTLNIWLKNNGGYVSQDLFVWASINKLGITFQGFIANSAIKSSLDAGKVVIVNVNNGGHWVLAHGYSGDNILVNDPGYSRTSYSLGEIVNGNTGVYTVPNFSGISSVYYSAKELIMGFFGIDSNIIYADSPAIETMSVIQE